MSRFGPKPIGKPSHLLLDYVDLACLMFIYMQGKKLGDRANLVFDMAEINKTLSLVAVARKDKKNQRSPDGSPPTFFMPMFRFNDDEVFQPFGFYFSDRFCELYERELPSLYPGDKASQW